MDNAAHAGLSLTEAGAMLGSEDGYDLWFGVPPSPGDATTAELQTLCQGAILVGRIAQSMGWDWTALLRNIDHISAPVDGYVMMEVGTRLFHSFAFRRALSDGVSASGLDPYKVKIVDEGNANAYILGHGLPRP